ncbi:MAG: DNA translocase FtsK [Acidobacteria bacterium]|nr:DNA translocase FtsK [Acidobacteriota bacterium]
MAVTLQVSEVRKEIYKLAGGAQSLGNGAGSTALLGSIFHDAFAELVGDDHQRNYQRVLEDATLSLEDWTDALIVHTYEKLIGPRLRQNQAALSLVPDQTLIFWDAAQEMCRWVAGLLWKAQERGLSLKQSLLKMEEELSWELSDTGWTDSVRLIGRADAIFRLPGKQDWCLIELKTGRTAPEADLAQACLYHQMLQATGESSTGTMALVSFHPQREELVLPAERLVAAQNSLRILIGKMAGVMQEVPSPPPDPVRPDYLSLGQDLERAFAEYSVTIKANAPIVGPTFLRYPIELGRRVVVNALRRHVEEVQVRLHLDGPPRISNEGGRLSIDLQRRDRQIVYFADIRVQLPAADRLSGNARVPIGIALDGKLQLADFSQPENAHLLVAGTPGSGKSEWLRSAVAGLLLTNTPETLKLAIADPKRNAFQELARSPFLYDQLAYSRDETFRLLELLVEEMELRYQKMGELKADKLTDYIRLTGQSVPRIFFVCDEFADLTMGEPRARRALESLVRRLGAKARAAGIHLILATQQPSRQVTSGPILAVITAKIVLRMQSIESQILLGDRSAASLLGKGDLLYKCIGDPVRLQSPFLPGDELARVFGST